LTVSTREIGVSDLLQKWHYGLYDTVRVSFKVFGFYVKKLFVPVPLNFAIREVAEGYVAVGLAVLVLSLYFLYKIQPLFRPYALGFFLILPAILLALTSIAWTPVAERYIYLPAAFTVIGLSASLLSIGRHFAPRTGVFALVVLLASASAVTAHRVYLWQDNLRLFADTKEKSPGFSAVDNELGVALMRSGDTVGAEKVLLAAIEKDEGNPLLYLTLAHTYQADGEYDKVDSLVDEFVARQGCKNLTVLTGFVRILERKLLDEKMDEEETRFSVEKLIALYKSIYKLSSDPFTLYRIAQLELGAGNHRAAAETFAAVVDKAPVDAYYRPAAEKLAIRLQQNSRN
jgi:tetratricopeptide (TPR) repeat protein